MAYERVYSVTDYWDGIRAGAADYGGVPHIFRSVWRADDDDWDLGRYFLRPISGEQAAWEAEWWAIWRRFASFYRGRRALAAKVPGDWGALPEDLDRHRELEKLLANVRSTSQADCLVATGAFRAIEPSVRGFIAPLLEVEWSAAMTFPDDQLVPIPAI